MPVPSSVVEPTPTLLEWDDNIPTFEEVHAEALKANNFYWRESQADLLRESFAHASDLGWFCRQLDDANSSALLLM